MPHHRNHLLLLLAVLLFGPATSHAEDALTVTASGDVGIGVSQPADTLHLRGDDGTTRLLVQEVSSTFAERVLMNLSNNGPVRFNISDSSSGATWAFKTAGAGMPFFDISKDGTGVAELRIDATTGNLTIQGDVITASCPSGCGADYVFEPGYPLRALDELAAFIKSRGHLPNIPSAAEMERDGLNVTQLAVRLLEKVEELTLYTLEQEAKIEKLQKQAARLDELEALVRTLSSREQ